MNKIEGGKIPARQLTAMLALSRIAPFTILFPMITGMEVPQDAWIASLLGMLLSIPFALFVARLGLRFPDKTIIEYSERLLGRYLGKLVGLVLIWYLISVAATTTRAVGDAYTIAIMPETPILVFMVVMVFLAANAARCGLEVVGRLGEHSIWIVLFFLILMFILPFDEMRFKNLAPVLARGFRPVVEPMGTAFSFFSMHIIVLGMILPYLNKPKDAARYSVYAILISGLLMTWLAAVLVAVFGPTVSGLVMPAFSLSRLISIANFLERIEAITMGAWTLSAGINLALFLWASAVGLAQLFGVSRYQPFVYPLGALVVAFGILFYESNVDMQIFFEFRNIGVFSMAVTLGTTAVLYLAALMRGKPSPRMRR
ncbi:MAG TPA: endospore germination permease [Firmicutes bacterium]|nr:endospore germination permease [Bacillota bacterium]